MKDATYSFLMKGSKPFLWGGKMIGEENLPKQGPAVFIANHMDSLGPVAMCCSIPLRLYPWLQAEMLDMKLAVPYFQWDVMERQLHLKPPLSRWLSWITCQIGVPFLRSLGCIPAHEHDYQKLIVEIKALVDILMERKCVLIFPEGNRPPALPDPDTTIYPFEHSFVRVAEEFYKASGELLNFYPVAVHPARLLVIGKHVTYNPFEKRGIEFHRLKVTMEREIHDMYLSVESAKADLMVEEKTSVPE